MQMDTTDDGRVHQLALNRVVLSRHEQNIPFLLIQLAQAQDSAWTQTRFVFPVGTERMTTSRLVPFLSFTRSFEGVKTRPKLSDK